MGNDQTIAYKVGGNYVMRTNFPYTSAMDRSELYLTFDARIGNKRVAIPEVKVANGVLATSQLVYRTLASASTATAADGYQQQISRRQDAQIKYLINQAKVRTSELNRTSVQDFVKMLRRDQSRPQESGARQHRWPLTPRPTDHLASIRSWLRTAATRPSSMCTDS